MKIALILLAVVVGLVVVDRLLLAAERRGWIYWRKTSASPGTAASAMLEMQSMLEPGKTHVLEATREEMETDDDGEP